jgi:hypothetical protein
MCQTAADAYTEAVAESRRADAELRATLTAEQRQMLNRVSDADVGVRCRYVMWLTAELCRHLPALAPVIRELVERIEDDEYVPPAA